jgi:hypothetical protein
MLERYFIAFYNLNGKELTGNGNVTVNTHKGEYINRIEVTTAIAEIWNIENRCVSITGIIELNEEDFKEWERC